MIRSLISRLRTGASGDHRFKVVSFFTEDNEYAEHAARLRETLDRWQVPYEIAPVRSAGVWEADCARKAKFIRDAWNASDIPLVWLDADATVEAFPKLFNTIDADFAVHRWNGWQFGSGTLYFGKSPAAGALLDQWVLRCEADPITWDQTHLQSAWCDTAATQRLRTYWLPRSYLQIFDAAQEGEPVIKHWQASRRPKTDGRSSSKPQFEITPEGIEQRKSGEPWRNAEESFWIAQGTAHIKPEIGHDFPEGFDVRQVLDAAIGGHSPVLEIGCGVGRIASLFKSDEYLGVEINPNAVTVARSLLPGHDIRIFDQGYAYPPAPCALFYTVLLHINDDVLPGILRKAATGRKRVIIAEIMDDRWRRDGDPPVFNRNPESYILAMQTLGFRLVHADKAAYARYDVEPWNIGRDSRLTILAFEPGSMP